MTHEEVGLLISVRLLPRHIAAEEDHVHGDQRDGDAPSVVPKGTGAASCAWLRMCDAKARLRESASAFHLPFTVRFVSDHADPRSRIVTHPSTLPEIPTPWLLRDARMKAAMPEDHRILTQSAGFTGDLPHLPSRREPRISPREWKAIRLAYNEALANPDLTKPYEVRIRPRPLCVPG